jgi:hypothetical protein
MRTIKQIAAEIFSDWGDKVSPHARPYLEAMLTLNTVDDMYFYDDARTVVLYALSNMSGYRTPRAAGYKRELKELLK